MPGTLADLVAAGDQNRDDIHAMFGNERRVSEQRRRGNDAALTAAIRFVSEVYDGRRTMRDLAEAMTTDDFPYLFADILDRQLLAEYREVTGTWQGIAKRRTVRDFRGTKLLKPLTGLGGLLEEVGELAEYPEATLGEEAPDTLTVAKMGKRIGLSWEDFVNDDLDQFRAIPGKFARMARRTEDYLVSRLYVGASGPHSSLYTAGNHNIVNQTNGASANNPPLSIAGLQDGLLVFGNQVDSEGNPIDHTAVTLVVPPALEVVANNIINATALELTSFGGVRDSGSVGEARLLAANWLSKRVKVVVNPLIPLIATSANGNRSWFLFADPNADREALTIAFLRGWEDPAVFVKSADARRVGGGDIDPLDGDFDHDAVTYKVRHVVGAQTVDPIATVASNGSGS